MSDDLFSKDNIAKSNWFKFEKPGDKISGTYIGVFDQPAKNMFSPQRVYEIKTSNGEIMNVGIALTKSKKYVNDRMRNVDFGRKVGFKFEKEVPSDVKGQSPAKSIEVYLGDVDPSYEADQAVADFVGSDDAPPFS